MGCSQQRVRLFGRSSLIDESGMAFSFATRRSARLLALLVLKRDGSIGCSELSSMLWHDADETHARKALHTELWRLRRCLASVFGQTPTIDCRLDNVCLSHAVLASTDCWSFELRLRESESSRGNDEEKLRALLSAQQLYSGDLLQGDNDELIYVAREQYRHRYLGCLENLISLMENRSQWEEVLKFSKLAITEDPLSELAFRGAIRAELKMGNRRAAYDLFVQLKSTLRLELGVSPDEATQEMMSVLSNGIRSASPAKVSTDTGVLSSMSEQLRRIADEIDKLTLSTAN
jgi:DNA-binding SARP family transcriptional activator